MVNMLYDCTKEIDSPEQADWRIFPFHLCSPQPARAWRPWRRQRGGWWWSSPGTCAGAVGLYAPATLGGQARCHGRRATPATAQQCRLCPQWGLAFFANDEQHQQRPEPSLPCLYVWLYSILNHECQAVLPSLLHVISWRKRYKRPSLL